MELLKEVANISGRSGLFRIVKPGRSGVIVEALDEKKKREMIPANARVSVLKDISIYKADLNEATPLADLFITMREKNGERIALDTKAADNDELFAFMAETMPDFDRERVHASDVKKLINWFNVLSEKMPELWDTPTEEPAAEEPVAAEEKKTKKAKK